ncbi:hypothetical protein D3C78_1686910 [compost metagenome]
MLKVPLASIRPAAMSLAAAKANWRTAPNGSSGPRGSAVKRVALALPSARASIRTVSSDME